MGDTGSLALGGALGSIAVVTNHEIVLAIVGGLFVLEAVSVIIQVYYYKRTGKRVFRMAPIHHHFEQLGWSEPTVVIRFWIISRSEEHTSELQSLMRISYAVFCLKKKKKSTNNKINKR